MGTRWSNNQLFDIHWQDIHSFDMKHSEMFVCPICLNVHSRNDIKTQQIDDGHIWPKHLRKNNEVAGSQHVLLCKSCNWTMGQRADKAVQDYMLAQKQISEGVLEDPVVTMTKMDMSSPPVRINTARLILGGNGKTIHFDFSSKYNSPESRRELFEAHQNKTPMNFTVQIKQKLVPSLAKVAFVTSAYLLAFRCFGYRFVFNEKLNPIRDYILKSFDSDDPPLPYYYPEAVRVFHSTEKYQTPEVKLQVPINKRLDGLPNPAYLEVTYLSVHVRLPFLVADRNLLTRWLSHIQPDQEMRLTIPITSTKFKPLPTDWDWDRILGTPRNYRIINNTRRHTK